MDTNQKMNDKPESAIFESLEMDSNNENLKDNANSSTPAERCQGVSSLIVLGFLGFLTGLSFTIIIPTAWGYVNTFVPEKYAGISMGLLLSLYALSSGISGVVLGYIYDIGVSLKKLILFGSLFQIIGNVFYFVGINIYVVVISRFIAGVGMGIVPLLLAEVSRRSTPETRAQFLVRILGCRQIGLIFGPSVTIFLEPLNFTMSSLTVTVYNAPGLLLVILWFIMGLVTICFFHDLPATIPVPKSMSNLFRAYSSKEGRTGIRYIFEQPVLIVLLVLTFIGSFSQSTLSTSFTPFASYEFNWGSFQVSIIYAFVGIEVILVYVLLNFITKKVRDQTILLFGFIGVTLICLMGVIFLPFSEVGMQTFPVFFLCVILYGFSSPVIVLATTSLFIQETKHDEQGVSQGIQRAIISIAVIVGPLYAGALLEKIWIMLLLLLIMELISIILIGTFYRSFRPKATDELLPLIPPVNKDNS